MHWAQAIALQGSSIGCVRMSKHTGHSSWSRTDRLSFANGGLGYKCSDEMTGGGALLLTDPMIMFGVIPGKRPLVTLCCFSAPFASAPFALS